MAKKCHLIAKACVNHVNIMLQSVSGVKIKAVKLTTDMALLDIVYQSTWMFDW